MSAFEDLLDKIKAGTDTQGDYDADLAELEAHHTAHNERMARHAALQEALPDADERAHHAAEDDNHTLRMIAEAMVKQAVSIGLLAEAMGQPRTRTGTVDLPSGRVQMTVTEARHEKRR
jgi:hypothetical protein